MLAVIKTGGKQYTVKEGDTLAVELLDVQEGDSFKFSEVLLISDGSAVTIGAPFIKGAAVEAEVIGNIKDKKILVFKKKRRKDYRKRIGHRQNYTRVKITKITG